MPVWSDCEIRVLEEGVEPVSDDAAGVRIESARIVVSYFDDEGPVVFAGQTDAGGDVFTLVCRSRPRRGRLALGDDGRTLHGEWEEGERSGTWRIRLS